MTIRISAAQRTTVHCELETALGQNGTLRLGMVGLVEQRVYACIRVPVLSRETWSLWQSLFKSCLHTAFSASFSMSLRTVHFNKNMLHADYVPSTVLDSKIQRRIRLRFYLKSVCHLTGKTNSYISTEWFTVSCGCTMCHRSTEEDHWAESGASRSASWRQTHLNWFQKIKKLYPDKERWKRYFRQLHVASGNMSKDTKWALVVCAGS